jgi:hypothetical protein
LDTGTSHTYIPEAVLTDLTSQIGGCEMDEDIELIACSCTSLKDIQSFWIDFNGIAIETESKDYVIFDSSE